MHRHSMLLPDEIAIERQVFAFIYLDNAYVSMLCTIPSILLIHTHLRLTVF